MLKHHYHYFLSGHKDKIHMACHSHHFWPDIAREAQLEYFDIAAKKSDQKWEYFFSEIIPENQKLISKHLNFSRPKDISFASNTHELLTKIISHYFRQDKIKILTSKSEFHSLTRQLKSFETWNKFEIIWLDNESEHFSSELQNTLSNNEFDLIFLSHVFFNSGKILSEKEIKNVISLKKNALFILDGYHSYCALPFDLKPYEDDLYYMAGAYKYAQAGEGMCFITLPKNCNLRPVLTGWMAEFGNLEQVNSNKDIPFSADGFKLWGSTLDMTAFLRFNRIWKMFLNEGVSISNIHHHVRDLQEAFLHENPLAAYLMDKNLDSLGHFITFDMKTEERARSINNSLLRDSILTDFRGSRLRFGFGPYLNKTEILQVKKALKA